MLGNFSLDEVQNFLAGPACGLLLLGRILPDGARGGDELGALRSRELDDLELLLENRKPLVVVRLVSLQQRRAGELLGLWQLRLEIVGQLVPGARLTPSKHMKPLIAKPSVANFETSCSL